MRKSSEKLERIGSVKQKILLALGSGVGLMLSGNPRKQFKILRSMAREWEEIDNRTLKNAISGLYQAKMISYQKNDDGTISMELTENGKRKFLQYNLKNLSIKRPSKWDSLWRIVIFDIPEKHKNARDALAFKLKDLGFYQMQKSVFIYPYNCKNEIDFIVEIFGIRPYVRFVIANETDIDLHLREIFHI